MELWVENLLLAIAAITVVALGADLAREAWLHRREQRHLERLRTERKEGASGTAAQPTAHQRLWPLERRLRAAGLGIGPVTFLAATAVLAVVAWIGLRFLLPRVLLAAIVGAVMGLYVPWLAVDALAKWRADRFERHLADALGFMVGSLEAGENPTQAFASAAEASRSLVRREFREVARRLTLGMNIRRALRRIIEGYDSEGVRLFTQTLIAKWEVGGDLIPIVESVARVIRERLKVRLHLKSQLAGARISSVMIALIPYALVPFFLWQRPESLERLLDHPLGPTLLTLAVLLQIIGFLWLRRLLRIEM